jgi:octaprenyl-diphosphate synthase
VLKDRSFEHVTHDELKEMLKRNGSIEYAMSIADHYAEQASEALDILPESDYKRALRWMPQFVVARDK